MSEEKRLLRTIRLRNLLSFGPNSEEIELKSLNVLVGPNGVGQKLRIFRNCQISVSASKTRVLIGKMGLFSPSPVVWQFKVDIALNTPFVFNKVKCKTGRFMCDFLRFWPRYGLDKYQKCLTSDQWSGPKNRCDWSTDCRRCSPATIRRP